MNVTWIGSPNYWAGRTQPVREYLLHWMNGTLASTDKTFNSNVGTDAATSAHRGYEDDERHDYVRREDTAFAARQANPFTYNWEISAAPGRPASAKTYDNVIRDLAADIHAHPELGTDVNQLINPHLKYVNTRCNGCNVDGTIREVGGVDLKRIRAGVAALLSGSNIPLVIAPTNKPALPQPAANKNTGGSVHLPAAATKWRIYREGGPYTIGNEVGHLNPSLQPGGLTYAILSNPTANVYVIQTRDFGRVAIYAGAETGATVAATNQGITMGSGGGKTVYLPATPTWRVYREGGPYVVGREIGYLAPALRGGLAYAVISQPIANVAVIQTRDFGRVAIYVGPETGASIK